MSRGSKSRHIHETSRTTVACSLKLGRYEMYAVVLANSRVVPRAEAWLGFEEPLNERIWVPHPTFFRIPVIPRVRDEQDP